LRLLFILTVSECTNPDARSPRGPYMCYVYPVCTHSPCFSARPERNIPFKSFCVLRGSLPVSVAKATVLAAAHFCGPRAVTQKAGQEDRGMHAKRIRESSAQAATCWSTKLALYLSYYRELQHGCHCCCPPCWRQVHGMQAEIF